MSYPEIHSEDIPNLFREEGVPTPQQEEETPVFTTPAQVLKYYWGYDTFRDLQEDIIQSILEGKDTLGLMPTGGGKSITFQVPALMKEGLCLVVTPLIALMKDQVQNLKRRGIKAIAVYSGMTREEIIIALENCIFGNYKFLYISPERLDTEIFRAKLRAMKVSMITVDESHCISQWGYDFRPAYLRIAEIRTLLPRIPVLALTATATPAVVSDIQQKLLFAKENVFRMSFERKNLAYIVRPSEDKMEALLHIFAKTSGSAIVYVRNRRKTKETVEFLTKEGFTANFYHAGLNNAVKDQRQKEWQEDRCRIMVATNAFGMGIDKPDVRVVVHLDLPDSPEAYFQEAGRGGRDGKKAYAVILYSPRDKAQLNKRVPDTFPDKEYIKTVYEHLSYYYQIAMGHGRGCVYDFDLNDFCHKFKHFPVQADSALKILSQAGYIEYTDEQDNASRLIFRAHREELYRLKESSKEAENLIATLLRSYTGIFTDYAYINEEVLAQRTGMTRQQVYDLLKMFSKRRIIDYIPRKKTAFVIYTRERIEQHWLYISALVYEERKERYIERINAMTEYASSQTACRSRMLLRYFGEKSRHECGVCDVCLERKKNHHLTTTDFEQLRNKLKEVLKERALPPTEIAKVIEADKELLGQTVQYMLDEGELTQKDGKVILNK